MKRGWVLLAIALMLAGIAAGYFLSGLSDTRWHVVADGLQTTTARLNGRPYQVVRIDLHKAKLGLFLKSPDGRRYGDFAALASSLRQSGRELLFATNAGIFDADRCPSGLHVEGGVEHRQLNLRDGNGNFYLKPNGVFLIDAAGARIIDSREYKPAACPILAVQSGPLLICSGKMHPAFRADSDNRRVRSGVGIGRDGTVVFLLSREPVTFAELAAAFSDGLGCQDALYLDGDISRFWVAGDTAMTDADFAGIFGVTR